METGVGMVSAGELGQLRGLRKTRDMSEKCCRDDEDGRDKRAARRDGDTVDSRTRRVAAVRAD